MSDTANESDRETVRLCQIAADEGDATAQNNLAVFHQLGFGGLLKDDCEASRLFKLAADQGNALAQANLGLFYERGRGGLPKDEHEAARLYSLSAGQGNLTGRNNIAVYYQQGRGGLPKDEHEAARLYRLSADQGDACAQCNLGRLYDAGRGVPQDDTAALGWYRKAADRGYAGAQCNLGLFYERGRGGLPKDEHEAARLYTLSANQGNLTARNNIAVYYQQGRGGLPRDDHEAARLYRLSAVEGDAPAQYNLGRLYAAGKGVPQDDAAALSWYRKAAEQGYAAAQCDLGVIYDEGRGVPQDDAVALGWYRRAAEQGHANAQFYLAGMFDKGQGVPQDYSEALSWLRKAADQRHAGAQFNIGVFYEKGFGGLPKDEHEAARFYKLAADQGHSYGQAKLGYFYERGLGGLPKDDHEAARLFKLAADQGHSTSQNNLGAFYEAGRGGLPQDKCEAARLYKLAAAQREGNPGPLDPHGTATLSSLPERLKNWLYCSHGVLVGKYGGRCKRCIREREEFEEARQREQDDRARQKRIEQEQREHRQRVHAAAESLQLSERLRLAQSLVPSIEELRALSSYQFEREVGLMFERLGFEVELTPPTNDGGRDLILRKGGKKYLGECKKYAAGNVSGRPDLQKFHSAIMTDGAVSGFFVTAGGFTRDAIEFAAKVRIELIDQDKLVQMMFESKPIEADNDAYSSLCRQCEEIVLHHLRAPRPVTCSNGHEIAPTLSIEMLWASERPRKARRSRRQVERLKRWRGMDPATAFARIDEVGASERDRKAIVGNTYAVRDRLRALGGRWNPELNAWMVPRDKAEEATSIVAGSSGHPSRALAQRGPIANHAPHGARSGDRIVLQYLDDGKTVNLTLSNERNDPSNGILSVASPLGKQVLGLSEGDQTELEVAGRLRPILITRVERKVSA